MNNTNTADTTGLVYIQTSEIHPHPKNPRKDIGDVTELSESIKAKGILQNLTVVRGHWMTQEEWSALSAAYKEHPTEELRVQMNTKWVDTGYTVIIGHRRLAGAKMAGVAEVPCVIVEMTDREQFETMVIENVQRADLTVYEQAEGFQMMLDMGGTVESVAKQTGFSETTIRKRLSLTKLDKQKFAASIERGATMQDYMELDKIKDTKTRNKVLESIGTANFRSELQSAINKEKKQADIERWISYVSPFAEKVKKQDPKIMTHVQAFNSYNDVAEYTPPEDSGTVKYFYRIEAGYGVFLYKEKVIDPDDAQKEEERKAAEQAKQAEFDRKKSELEEMRDLHHDLRTQFVMEFGASKKCADSIMVFAVQTVVQLCKCYNNTVDWQMVADMLDISMADDQKAVDAVEYAAAIKERPAYSLLVTAYASLEKESNQYYDWNWRDGAKVFEHDTCDRLDAIYLMLTSLGYQMSDEEKAMKAGTHPLICNDPEEEPDELEECLDEMGDPFEEDQEDDSE